MPLVIYHFYGGLQVYGMENFTMNGMIPIHKCESLDGHFKKRSSSWSHMLGTQIPFIQGFGASNSHIWHRNFGRRLEKLSLEGLEKGMTMHMMSHVKVHSSTTYHISLVEFGKLPIELYSLKLTMGFQQRLVHLPPSWLVSKATSLFSTPGRTKIEHLAQINKHVEDDMGSISLGNPWQPNHINNNMWWCQRGVFLLRVELFPSRREETILPPPRGFSRIRMWIRLVATIDSTTTIGHCCLPHLVPETCHWKWTVDDHPFL